MTQSTSTKPYLIRALYEWCLDNGNTPYIAVWVNEHTRVPAQYVQDEQIVLSISPTATKDLFLDNEWVNFQQRKQRAVQKTQPEISEIARGKR